MNYKLVRSKRKTLTVCIKDGKVTVKAPKTTSIEYIENFVAQKRGWIEKKLAEYDRRVGILGDVMSYKSVMISGEICPIVYSDAVKRIRYENGALNVPRKFDGAETETRRAVASWYKRTAAGVLEHTLESLSIRTGLKYKSFALTNARTKWGSCDGECNIRLNWRLLMLDDALSEYVIIHELCHTVHHDHSAEFWSAVESFCPDMAKHKKKLKTFAPLTALYR